MKLTSYLSLDLISDPRYQESYTELGWKVHISVIIISLAFFKRCPEI